jgi:hypothetical protein
MEKFIATRSLGVKSTSVNASESRLCCGVATKSVVYGERHHAVITNNAPHYATEKA